jgi:hypothetical protein
MTRSKSSQQGLGKRAPTPVKLREPYGDNMRAKQKVDSALPAMDTKLFGSLFGRSISLLHSMFGEDPDGGEHPERVPLWFALSGKMDCSPALGTASRFMAEHFESSAPRNACDEPARRYNAGL